MTSAKSLFCRTGLCFLFLFVITLLSQVSPTLAAEIDYRTETVYDPISLSAQTVRDTPVYNSDLTTRFKLSGKKVTLPAETSVTVTDERTENGKKWFQFSFLSGEKLYTGYARNTRIVLKNAKPSDAVIINLTVPKKLRARASDPTALRINGKKVTVTSGTAVSFVAETAVGTAKWYRISLDRNGQTATGYIKPRYVQLTQTRREEKIYALTDEEFNQNMVAQGIPEAYRPALRELHTLHPFWEFRVFETGLDWNTALRQESKVGRNLIPNSKSDAWKSMDPAAYDAETGKWKIFDGTSWVAASEAAVAYYMDPRNFLNERTIFQFELQEYQPKYQTATGVDKIFSNTPFAGSSFAYIDPLTGKNARMTYTNAYLNAAAQSLVSPIHLASRTKQEVVTSATTTSGAVTGNNANYPGIYNFYNIGAVSGKNPMENGLKWASTGDTWMRPWTDPYRSIVGGALYIGTGYINKGQNTVYLEKFNMTANDRYNHQYMTNVEAACSEAIKIRKAYEESGLFEQIPLVFSIPVYENMPETNCPAPV